MTEYPILDFKPNDRIELILPGGAGFGKPEERKRELIENDIKNGYTTKDHAKTYYN